MHHSRHLMDVLLLQNKLFHEKVEATRFNIIIVCVVGGQANGNYNYGSLLHFCKK